MGRLFCIAVSLYRTERVQCENGFTSGDLLLGLNVSNIFSSHIKASSLEEDDDDDSDFVEVPEKEGYESDISGHLQVEDG